MLHEKGLFAGESSDDFDESSEVALSDISPYQTPIKRRKLLKKRKFLFLFWKNYRSSSLDSAISQLTKIYAFKEKIMRNFLRERKSCSKRKLMGVDIKASYFRKQIKEICQKPEALRHKGRSAFKWQRDQFGNTRVLLTNSIDAA